MLGQEAPEGEPRMRDPHGPAGRFVEPKGGLEMSARLSWLPKWTTKRRQLAAEYRHALNGIEDLIVPPFFCCRSASAR